MPVITALETHPRNRELVKLHLDQGAALDLPLLHAARFRTGQVLTAAQVEALGEAEAIHAAYERAIRLLSYRPRSAQEVRTSLARHGTMDSQIETVIERLRNNQYLDDLAFAQFWVENRARFKPMAARALRHELWRKGVADDVIAAALDDYDELAAAQRAATARLQRFRGKTPQFFRRKLGEMLSRRGFDYSTITDVLRQLERDLEDNEVGFFAADDDG